MTRAMIPFEEVAFEDGLEQGLEQGRGQGLEQGLEQGRKQGLEQGREFMCESVMDILAERFDTVPLSLLAAIREITDVPHLKTLIKTAVKIDSLEEFEKVLSAK